MEKLYVLLLFQAGGKERPGSKGAATSPAKKDESKSNKKLSAHSGSAAAAAESQIEGEDLKYLCYTSILQPIIQFFDYLLGNCAS